MSNNPAQKMHGTAEEYPAPLPYARAIRWLGVGGGILALLCLLSGTAMLLMKWAGAAPPAMMSQIPLILLPVAFMALMIALMLLIAQRHRA